MTRACLSKYDVKRGLRNADGSGVLVGLTTISNVHGYNKTAERSSPTRETSPWLPRPDLIDNAHAEDRFGYEEAAYLLITGALPTADELATSTRASTAVASCPRAS